MKTSTAERALIRANRELDTLRMQLGLHQEALRGKDAMIVNIDGKYRTALDEVARLANELRLVVGAAGPMSDLQLAILLLSKPYEKIDDETFRSLATGHARKLLEAARNAS